MSSRGPPPPPPGRGRPTRRSEEISPGQLAAAFDVLRSVESEDGQHDSSTLPEYVPSPAVSPHRKPRPAAPLAPKKGRASVHGRPVPPPPSAAAAAAEVAATVAAPSPEKKSSKSPQELADRRKRICGEIVATEERYSEQLEQIVSCYLLPLQQAGVLKADAEKRIFINVNVLTKLHFEFLRTLRASMESGPGGEDMVGKAMLDITPMLTLYIEYINRFHDGGVLLRELAEHRRFRKALEKCSHSNMSGIAGLETLMVCPVQRVPRYVLLLREVLKFTPEGHPDRQQCQRAHEEMEKVTSFINEKKREYEQLQRLAFVSQRLAGGNMGALRETAKNTGKAHDFRSNRTLIPHSCDWCKEFVRLSEYRCASCGYQAHPHCFKQVPTSCSDHVIDRDTQPELIRNYRKIIKEEKLLHKVNRMDRLGEYEQTPFEAHSVLLCNDSVVLLKQDDNGEATGRDAPISPRSGDEKFNLIDLVKWTSSLIRGPNAALNVNVAPDLFSLSNRRQNLLHTFKVSSSTKKEEWIGAIQAAMDDWELRVRKNEEHEKVVTEKLTGLQFNITGTVPVASALEKAFTVYIIQMTNANGTLMILKRYRQLLALHHHLEDVYGEDALPKFPGKKLLGNTDERFLQKRSRKLAAYLQGAMNLKGILADEQVRKFLTTTVSAKNEDELLPSFMMRTVDGQEYAESILETEMAEDGDDDDENDNVDAEEMVDILAREDMSVAAAMSESEASAFVPRPQIIAPVVEEEREVIALYDYDGSVANSLKLHKGDILKVVSRADGWWYCQNQYSEVGYVPEAYLATE